VYLNKEWYRISVIGIACYLIQGFFDYYIFTGAVYLLISMSLALISLERVENSYEK
jgi:hypothetical protein